MMLEVRLFLVILLVHYLLRLIYHRFLAIIASEMFPDSLQHRFAN